MRMEGYAVQHCSAIRCPFESICRNRDFHTDRSNGCETQNFIITEAKKMEPTPFVYTPGPMIISGQGKSRIQLVKQLRDVMVNIPRGSISISALATRDDSGVMYSVKQTDREPANAELPEHTPSQADWRMLGYDLSELPRLAKEGTE